MRPPLGAAAVLSPGTLRLLRRIPHTTVYSAAELLLLSLLAIQCARLLWVTLTPVGPVGEWKALGATRVAVADSSALLTSFDPFFRTSADNATIVVTSLNLKLFGVREDRATGRGSAIIALPDGQQHSFAVNDEIMPGVVLVQVGSDNVTISRNGTAEQLFLDQSQPATVASPASTSGASTSAPTINFAPGATPPPAPAEPPVRYQPRMNGAAVTGIAVSPGGDGAAFRAAGLQSGDVIVSVNGQRITSTQQAQSLGASLSGGAADVQVERGGRVISLRVRAGQ